MMRNAYSTYLLFILVLIFCVTTIVEELTAFPLSAHANQNTQVLNNAATRTVCPKQVITTQRSTSATDNEPGAEAVQFKSIIESLIWADMDGNGKFDQGEVPLTDITVRLLDHQGVVLQMVTTDYKGAFLFDDLLSGDYMITADLTTVPYQMRPSTPSLYYISLFEPTIFLTQGFGFVPHEETTTTLTGKLELDPVKQTQLANDELKVQINLLDQNGYIIGSAPASTDGSYAFYNIEEGVYSVEKVINNEEQDERVSLLQIE